MLGRGCLCDQPPVKILGIESLTSFPGGPHFTCVVTIHDERMKRVSAILLGGGSVLSPHSMCLFLLLILALYPWLRQIINV